MTDMTETGVRIQLRPYAGEADLPEMVRVANAAIEADQIQERLNEEQLRIDMRPSEKFDPAHDLRLADVDGALVGFVKTEFIDTNDGLREYRSWCEVDPAWRRRRVGTTLLEYAKDRIVTLAASHDIDRPRVAGAWAADSDIGGNVLLKAHGYEPARWFFHMNRDLTQPIEIPPMPEGLEVRPVTIEDTPKLWIADNEAFLDHWGGIDDSPEAYQRWVDESTFDPSLHVVAFDGDEIAGAVINTIYPDANAKQGVLHGWLDSVFTRRAWRGRGLARALVARSLVVLRDRGMTEGILGADADNETGAIGVYTSNGFVVRERFTAYRRPFEVNR